MERLNVATLSGLGDKERQKLSLLLRETSGTISVSEAANILNTDTKKTANLLSLYAKKGWLKRIYQGVYLPIPLESDTSDIVAEEPFVIAQKLFSPCYIGGMNATNYWGLTEQIFQTITVIAQKNSVKRKRDIKILDTEYIIHTVKPSYFFGLKTIWLTNVKVQISDPSRTIIDMMIFPQFCGGLRFIEDGLKSYYQSKYLDIDLLIKYLGMAENGAAIKRLGYLFEKYFPSEEKLINYCLDNLTKGYINIVPGTECSRLIRRWNLWLPDNRET